LEDLDTSRNVSGVELFVDVGMTQVEVFLSGVISGSKGRGEDRWVSVVLGPENIRAAHTRDTLG